MHKQQGPNYFDHVAESTSIRGVMDGCRFTVIDCSVTNCYGGTMARPRTFDEATVLEQARGLFSTQGYHGTSIDDLVKATGLLRGSLYKAFGSKRNLFHALLSDIATRFDSSPQNLDLLTVGLKDLAADDEQIRLLCAHIIGDDTTAFSELLGNNLLSKMREK